MKVVVLLSDMSSAESGVSARWAWPGLRIDSDGFPRVSAGRPIRGFLRGGEQRRVLEGHCGPGVPGRQARGAVSLAALGLGA